MTGGIPGSPATNGEVTAAVGVGCLVDVLMVTAEESGATDDSVVDMGVVRAEVAGGREDELGALLDTPPVEALVHPTTRTADAVRASLRKTLLLEVTASR